MAPKGVHVLIPGTLGSIILHGERDFYSFKNIKIENLFWIIWVEDQCIHRVFIRGKRASEREAEVTMEVEMKVRHPGGRNTGPCKSGKRQETDPSGFQKNQPWSHLGFSHLRLLLDT